MQCAGAAVAEVPSRPFRTRLGHDQPGRAQRDPREGEGAWPRFRILIQQQWEISRRYAMFATPIAYLIDEQGVIARDVVVGADAILELLSQEKRPSELKGSSGLAVVKA